MKTPVCEADVKSGELCPSCKKKLSEGKISQLDFDVAQMLFRINDRYNITNASFYKALDLGRVVLILTRGEVGLLIGRQGKVVGELSSSLGRKVRIAEMQGDMKKTVADIIAPARLLGINQAFHEGKEVSKVRIARADCRKLPMDEESLGKILRSLFEGEVLLLFE